MPFVHAAQQLKEMLGVQVSRSTAQRLTEAAGKQCERWQNEPVFSSHDQEFSQQGNATPPMVMSPDGAMVFVRGKGWQEVKTLALAELVPLSSAVSKPCHEKRTQAQTTFSRLSDAETFSDLCSGEISRRGIERAPRVCAIQDGALWLQGFVDGHRHDAVRILDFYHAAEYINSIGEEVRALGGHLPKDWLDGVLHRLKHEGPTRVLKHLRWLVNRFGPTPTLQSQLTYLLKRETQMQYPQYQADGWPIGSGLVESAHKRVLQARLKGSGMQWAEPNVNAMLALRMMIDNQRWDQEWQARRDNQLKKQHEQAQSRQSRQQQQAMEELKPLLVRFLFLQAHCQLAQRVKLTTTESSSPPQRRSSFNPWRGDPSKAFSLQAKK
jgi:hypothetical protein